MTVEPLDLAQVDVRAEPDAPVRRAGGEHRRDVERADVLWLGPDEWLIVGDPAPRRDRRRARAPLAGQALGRRRRRRQPDRVRPGRRARAAGDRGGLDLHPDRWTRDVRPDPVRPGPGDPPAARRANDARLRPPVVRRLRRAAPRDGLVAQLLQQPSLPVHGLHHLVEREEMERVDVGLRIGERRAEGPHSRPPCRCAARGAGAPAGSCGGIRSEPPTPIRAATRKSPDPDGARRADVDRQANAGGADPLDPRAIAPPSNVICVVTWVDLLVEQGRVSRSSGIAGCPSG